MRYPTKIFFSLVVSLSALCAVPVIAAPFPRIAGWKETKGITEEQAIMQARSAIHQDIGVDEDGQICTIDEMWGWEREKDLRPDYPQERGEIFAIAGIVTGPHAEMACAGTQNYDCRVVFNKPKQKSIWKVKYTECEVAVPGRNQ